MDLIANLTASQLRRAADIKEKIASLENELSKYLGGTSTSSAATPRRKFRMSASGRARIIAAQKARWAKVNAAKGSAGSAKAAKKGSRKMSAAGRAKIAAAARARWAKAKASGKKAL
jgi:hypothetical protein